MKRLDVEVLVFIMNTLKLIVKHVWDLHQLMFTCTTFI
jgi:hypothetical protein